MWRAVCSAHSPAQGPVCDPASSPLCLLPFHPPPSCFPSGPLSVPFSDERTLGTKLPGGWSVISTPSAPETRGMEAALAWVFLLADDSCSVPAWCAWLPFREGGPEQLIPEGPGSLLSSPLSVPLALPCTCRLDLFAVYPNTQTVTQKQKAVLPLRAPYKQAPWHPILLPGAYLSQALLTVSFNLINILQSFVGWAAPQLIRAEAVHQGVRSEGPGGEQAFWPLCLLGGRFLSAGGSPSLQSTHMSDFRSSEHMCMTEMVTSKAAAPLSQ